MKTTYIRYSWQLLTVLLFQTGFVHLITIRNDPTTKETSAMLHGDKRQHPFRKYTLGITNTIDNRIGNLNQEFRSKFPDNSFISNRPHLTVRCTPNKVYEGQSATLCCLSNSRFTTIDLWWDLKSLLLSSKHDTNVLCHKIVNVSRYNSGDYRCYAENKFAIVNAEVKLKVLYPPDIPDQHVQLTEKNVSRNLHCLAHGVPEVFIYGQWEHVSFFGEYIRYLDSTAHGRVALPHIAKKINRYQDSGIYICTASNGVIDRSGNSFQNGTVYVIANGPPVFVEKIKNKQYGNLGEIFKLKFVLYTKSEIIGYNVKSENQDIAASMEKTSVNGTTIFHGTEITVESIQVVLSFKISNNNNSQIYTVTICNGFGNNSFEVEIELVTTGSVHLPSTINTRKEEECESIMHRRKDKLPLAVNYTPNKVYEGRSVTLCCCSKGLTKSIEMWSGKKHFVLSSKYDTNVLCHKIMNVSRHDSGVYRCFVYNGIGILHDEIMFEVLYPPNIQDQHINVTDNNISLTLQCLAHGLPTNYTYGRWKHLSFFYQHIRYLDSTIAGRVTLPPIETKYQDNGIYICTASNGVVDRTGNGFQNGKIFLIANGPPVFVTKIDMMQYDQPGKIFNLEFIVYTKSQIKSYDINSANNDIPASMLMKSVNKTMNFHGTLIYVEAIKVVLSFKTATVSNCHNYTVTLGNGYGNNSFVVELKSVQEDVRKINITRIALIIISAILLSSVVISGIAICLNTRHKDNSATEGTCMTDSVEGFPVSMNHRQNNSEERKDPLTDVKNRTVQADSRHVLSSNETGYADVWC